MSVSQITRQVYSGLEQKGYIGHIVAIEHLADLEKEINKKHNQGLLDDTFYKERLAYFTFRIPEGPPDIKSVIITSAPQPQKRVTFNKDKKAYHLVIPPSYSFDTDEKVENILTGILDREGYSLYPALLPLKILAGCSGLVKYGRNNITYTESAGSFHRLKAFLSDLPVVEDTWLEPQLLESCHQCTACIKKCPTGAISPEQFVIRSEKCLTFHNERTAHFPDWIDSAWHNCLIGCMECQLCCPANKDLFNWYERTEQFTSEETELILGEIPRNQLPQSIIGKLENIDLLEDLELIPRNLRVLLSQH